MLKRKLTFDNTNSKRCKLTIDIDYNSNTEDEEIDIEDTDNEEKYLSDEYTDTEEDTDNEYTDIEEKYLSEEEDAEEEIYEVEKIINKKIINKKIFYLIKWKHYSDMYNTWEPKENLNCDQLIYEFENKNNLINYKIKNNYIYIDKIILDNNEFNKSKIKKIINSLNNLKNIDITFENLLSIAEDNTDEFIRLLLQNYWINLFNKTNDDINENLFNDILNNSKINYNSCSDTIYDKCIYCNRQRLLTFNFNNDVCNNVGFYCAEKIYIIKKVISTIKNIKNNLRDSKNIYFPQEFIDVVYNQTIKLTTYANNNSNINKWFETNNINDLDIKVNKKRFE